MADVAVFLEYRPLLLGVAYRMLGSASEAEDIVQEAYLRWSAIQMAQIEGRCHRDGRFAQVYWAYADATIEEKIALVVCNRLRAMKGMTGDDTDTVDEIAQLLAEAAS